MIQCGLERKLEAAQYGIAKKHFRNRKPVR
jgi:hypothetical protein